jgi:starch synthase
MQIVFATAEVAPFARTGGLGDVCGALPKALESAGHEVIVFSPLYRQVRSWFAARDGAPEPVATLRIDWIGAHASVELSRTTLPGSGVAVYFISNDSLFDREQLYSNRADGFDDHLERFE